MILQVSATCRSTSGVISIFDFNSEDFVGRSHFRIKSVRASMPPVPEAVTTIFHQKIPYMVCRPLYT